MTIVVESPTATPTDKPHPITGSMRWFAGAVIVAGGACQLLEFVLEPAINSSSERVDWWLGHSMQIQLSQAFGILAIPFLISGFLFMLRLGRESSRRITTVAVSMLVVAMVGLAGVHGVEMTARWAAVQGHVDAAVGILDMSNVGIPGVTLFAMFLPMAVFGSLLLAVAMWRSPYVPHLVVLLSLTFSVLDFAASMGLASHTAALASNLVLAWAVITGYVRSPRTPRGGRAD